MRKTSLEELEDIIENFNSALTKNQPDLCIRGIFHKSLFNCWEVYHSDTSRDKRYDYCIAPIEKILGIKLKYKLWECTHTRIILPQNAKEIFLSAIERLKNLKPSAISVNKLGGHYRMINDGNGNKCHMLLMKGTVFKLIHVGSGWDNHSIIELISGRIRYLYPTYYANNNKKIRPSEKVYTIEELKTILGKNVLTTTFDPYGAGDIMPAEKLK
jgi:hypothetical protein